MAASTTQSMYIRNLTSVLNKSSATNTCECNEALSTFLSEFDGAFSFPGLTFDDSKALVEALSVHLQDPSSKDIHLSCLGVLRILSRDKDRLDAVSTQNTIATLIKAGCVLVDDIPKDYSVVIEAQKCLSNLIMNSPAARKICCAQGCVEGLFQRLKCYKDPDFTSDAKYYYMRLLFLLTALEAKHSLEVCRQLHGLTYLTEVLVVHYASNSSLTCEILKTFFNLTAHIPKKPLDEEDEILFRRLVSLIREILVFKYVCDEEKDKIHADAINLLTNIPSLCYDELLTEMEEEAVDSERENKEVEYDGKDMTAINVILDYLDTKLSAVEKVTTLNSVEITPVLIFLYTLTKHLRYARKFCRCRVLPPLRDVSCRPEEGSELRNKLAKLMTCPVLQVAKMSSEFLFVLCKENPSRLVKYTGYGNAAGLLARHGLMTGGPTLTNTTTDYSSDSDQSDTEEYEQAAPNFNAVTGQYEQPRPSPLAGMTDAEKEEEAMKLVAVMDKMARRGLLQPLCIDTDDADLPGALPGGDLPGGDLPEDLPGNPGTDPQGDPSDPPPPDSDPTTST